MSIREAALALLAGAVLCSVAIPFVIAAQRRHRLGQHVYEDAPSSHAAKQGTPTMGGLAFVAAAFAGLAISGFAAPERGLFCLVALAAAVGYADDLLILKGRRALGLRARWKFAFMALLALGYTAWIGQQPGIATENWFGRTVDIPHALWFALAVLALVGTANAVNLTDGLDGLAVGTVIPALIALQLPAAASSIAPIVTTNVAMSVLGACFTFLWFNRHPARVFMGDTGSLLLGALIAGSAIASHLLLLLPLFGLVFVVEALSVMAQVASFKMFGRRILRMSPLHHHFELSGWRETSVTAGFVACQTACAAAAWLLWCTSNVRGAQAP
ncbi:MAG: phospho-N-acetylmuramoyl-pentapeptide-transferase [Candidatus Eremiobacter antarcticus]|nr:phospho-N-acetylmuramoyl-pentapeptide-transferase [Candidatus Eremiobacteraeota bacterium]MBC5808350.1 phospho-N-acetylmuramoyl-pentapeptide-transferase [Candidatus Eremiobacteraeota bacterium]